MSKDSQTQLAKALDTVSSSSSSTGSTEEKSRSRLHELQRAYEFVREKFSLDFVAFGVCDKIAGTPAIELLQHLVCITYANLPPSAKVLHALSINDYLGHDAEREPDAESGATQALFLSRPYTSSTRKVSRIDSLGAIAVLPHAAVFISVMASVLMLAAMYYSKATLHLPSLKADEPEL